VPRVTTARAFVRARGARSWPTVTAITRRRAGLALANTDLTFLKERKEQEDDHAAPDLT
jgi:hypothetical protein